MHATVPGWHGSVGGTQLAPAVQAKHSTLSHDDDDDDDASEGATADVPTWVVAIDEDRTDDDAARNDVTVDVANEDDARERPEV
ncbi:MAG: hypothetical protein FWD17_11185 [Polyangiaceae bacterium]|nr:hypothetical protein [Polyangiaceae bacterium]